MSSARAPQSSSSRSATRRFAVLDEMASEISGASLELIRSGPGPAGELMPMVLGEVEVLIGRFGAPTLTRGSVDPTRLSVMLALGPDASGRWDGRPCVPDALLLYAPGAQQFAFDAPEARWARITLGPEHLGRAFAATNGRELVVVPARARWIRPRPELLERLKQTLSGLSRSIGNDPKRVRRTGLLRCLESQLLMELCVALGSDRRADENVDGSAPRTGTDPRKIVQAVDRHLETTICESVRLADLSAAANACERSVEYAFQRLLATTPMRYVKLRRLRLVHQQLRDSIATSTTVTRVAFDAGFGHLSQFAHDYHAVYGETPSATLRRA